MVAAWKSSWNLKLRDRARNRFGNDEYITVGYDRNGNSVAMTATYDERRNVFLVYHANRPAPRNFVDEYRTIGG